MFDRFTDGARRVVVLAQEEARLLDYDHIGTEHILSALIHEGEGVAAKALESLGVGLQAVRNGVEEIIGQGDGSPSGRIPFTLRAKKVLEFSLREALQLGHSYIGTEHILLGLIREGEGVAARVLVVKIGVDLARVRQRVIQQLVAATDMGAGSSGPAKAAISSETPAPAEAAKRAVEPLDRTPKDAPRTVFVVHGHAHGRMNEVARAVHGLTGREPIVLREQPDRGRTIIEKFEDHAFQAGAAVVILSGDDEGRARTPEAAELQLRARQNVVYEMGWFHGRLGRHGVVALIDDGVESPSDISGVLYIPFDTEGIWRYRLGRELRAAGIEVDLGNLP